MLSRKQWPHYYLDPWSCRSDHATIIFAGFNYSLGAVKDGYKLALVYRLAQRSAGPLPVFQDISDVMNTMEEDLDLWEAEKLLPKRAFYILENE